MGSNTLTTRSDGQIITQDWFNDFNQAWQQTIVPRNASLVPTNRAGSIGSSTYNFESAYFQNYFLDNTLLDLTAFTTTTNKIISGLEAAGTGGFPGFLTAGGAANLVATLSAVSTNFLYSINGIAYTLSANLTFTTTAGYSTNNTCLVNNAAYAADPNFSKTEGEHGASIIVDTAGSNITAAVGKFEFFTINNGSETELFFAYVVSATELRPIYRGMGGTTRIGFTDNDTITLCKATYFFVGSNGTAYTTTIFPLCVDALPSAGTAGRYANRKSDDTWHYDDGANWTQVDRCWVGFGASPNTTDNTYVGYFPHIHDFNKAWNSKKVNDCRYTSASTVTFPVGFQVNVAGVNLIAYSEIVVDLSSSNDRESGVSETASTLFYLYADKNLKIRYSNICPRPLDARGGFYHPSKLWRCVGAVYNDGSSNIVPFIYKDGYYEFIQNGTGSADYTSTGAPTTMVGYTALSNTYATYQFLMVPNFCQSIIFQHWSLVAAQFYFMQRARMNTYGKPVSNVNLNGQYSALRCETFIENGTIVAREGTTNYSAVAVNSFRMIL